MALVSLLLKEVSLRFEVNFLVLTRFGRMGLR